MTSSPTAHIDTFVIDGLPPAEQWPELRFDGLPNPLPARLNAATELLDKAIDRGWGDRPCMADATDSWTYGQVLEWANRLAGVLVQQGVVPGNRVL
ncbi:MAG TPA: 2-aminobenzoate-CoA ligase, partial [Euzebya sp.]|nr:2-aminobenzoate-CoA ligase [Euzebya sp.]